MCFSVMVIKKHAKLLQGQNKPLIWSHTCHSDLFLVSHVLRSVYIQLPRSVTLPNFGPTDDLFDFTTFCHQYTILQHKKKTLNESVSVYESKTGWILLKNYHDYCFKRQNWKRTCMSNLNLNNLIILEITTISKSTKEVP